MEAEEILGALQAARAQLFDWQQLEKNVGWKRLSEILKSQRDSRVGSILRAPTEQIVDVFVREYERGEAAGLDLALSLSSVEITRLQEEIRLLESRITIEENTDVYDSTTDQSDPSP